MRGAQTRIEMEQTGRAWVVWHTEALNRSKKIPTYDKFVSKKTQTRQTPEQLNAMGEILARAWGAKKAA